jgi:predicted ATPase/DNA-binding winged helix-turn-helix (wHTH) protein
MMPVSDDRGLIEFGPFRLSRHQRALRGPSGELPLSSRAFDILLVLLDNPGRMVTKGELLDRVWPGLAVEENNLQVHVSALRKALGPGLITTIPGRGYKYVGDRPQLLSESLGDEAANGYVALTPMPPGSSLERHERRIPAAPTHMVGRDGDLQELLTVIAVARATTIVGMGGVGKTRLAIEAASRSESSYRDGACFVDLCPLLESSLVPTTIARALAAPLMQGEAPIDSVCRHLRCAEILLVLDNCEHVIDGVAAVVKAILGSTTGARILATSREPIGISGETLFQLSPLECPRSGETDPSAINRAGAIQLFVERLRSLDRAIAIDAAGLSATATICRQLDGIPLALEMAAARVPTLGVEALCAALSAGLSLRMTGERTAQPRHRTLSAMLDWSGDLLDAPEQSLLRRLSVFPGKFDLPAAHAICAEPASEAWETAEQLSALVRKSLVLADETAERRFRLLDMVKAHAREKLEQAGEVATASRRHAEWTLRALQSGLHAWEHMAEATWLERFASDLDDCRAALSWADKARNDDLYLDLAGTSYRLWLETGNGVEGLRHAQAALQRIAPSAAPDVEIRARIAVAELAANDAMHALAMEAIRPAIALCRAAGDDRSLAMALLRASFALTCQRSHEEAFHYAQQAALPLRQLDEPKLAAWATLVTGMNLCARGDVAAGIPMCDSAVAMHRAIGEDRAYRRSLLFFAESAFWYGNTRAAIACGQTLVQLLRRQGFVRNLDFALCNLAAYLLATNRSDEAKACLQECFKSILHETSSWPLCAIQNYAFLAALEGKLELAAQLLGYLDRGFDEGADRRQQTEQIIRDHLIDLLQRKLGDGALEKLSRRGAVWSSRTVEGAINEAFYVRR